MELGISDMTTHAGGHRGGQSRAKNSKAWCSECGISACLVSRRLCCPPCVPAGAGEPFQASSALLPARWAVRGSGLWRMLRLGHCRGSRDWARQRLCQSQAGLGGREGPAVGFGSTLRHHRGSVMGQAMHNVPLCSSK